MMEGQVRCFGCRGGLHDDEGCIMRWERVSLRVSI